MDQCVGKDVATQTEFPNKWRKITAGSLCPQSGIAIDVKAGGADYAVTGTSSDDPSENEGDQDNKYANAINQELSAYGEGGVLYGKNGKILTLDSSGYILDSNGAPIKDQNGNPISFGRANAQLRIDPATGNLKVGDRVLTWNGQPMHLGEKGEITLPNGSTVQVPTTYVTGTDYLFVGSDGEKGAIANYKRLSNDNVTQDLAKENKIKVYYMDDNDTT